MKATVFRIQDVHKADTIVTFEVRFVEGNVVREITGIDVYLNEDTDTAAAIEDAILAHSARKSYPVKREEIDSFLVAIDAKKETALAEAATEAETKP